MGDSRTILCCHLESGYNRLVQNIQWEIIVALARPPGKHKNNNRTSSNILYLGSINCKDMFANDD